VFYLAMTIHVLLFAYFLWAFAMSMTYGQMSVSDFLVLVAFLIGTGPSAWLLYKAGRVLGVTGATARRG
jgi:hypothetical protein